MTRNKQHNARFWIVVRDSYVKVTLQPDTHISWQKSEPTEEGWSYEAESWYLDPDDGLLYWEYCNREEDCDGVFERSGQLVASELAAEPGYKDPEVRLPAWQDLRSCQRDHSAEAAGY
jgi:hypothetical protein